MNRLVRKTGRRPNRVALNPELFLDSVTSALDITGLPVKCIGSFKDGVVVVIPAVVVLG
jgi:hypothetical protein